VETFFQQNETVIVFAHGLVLFALGFAAWLQRRRATRLALTSSLIWLASYAFFEALVIWGFVFIPIQSTYLAPEVIEALVVLRAVLQLVAVACLLQFGLRLVPWTRRHLALLTVISMVVWVGIVVGATAAAGPQGWTVIQWEGTTAQFSRYLFLVPGALLSAYGMWLQRDALTKAGMVGIRPYAALAAGALLLYAVVGGLVLAATIIQLAISRQREYQADLTGAELLGDPEPLACALENLQRGAEQVPMQVNPAAAPMYIVNPLAALNGRGASKLFSTHPPMEERIRRLRALAPVIMAQAQEATA